MPPGGVADKIAVPVAALVGPTTAAACEHDDAAVSPPADEGTLTIDNAEGKAGADLVANIKVTPASGRHVSTEFPIKLTLAADRRREAREDRARPRAAATSRKATRRR